MPNYAKLMKEVMPNKKLLEAYGTMSFLENYSALIHKKKP